jgi:hypothetical protein
MVRTMPNMLNPRRVVAGLTASSLLALSASAGATTPSAPDIPPAVRTALLEYAIRDAAIHGDTHPYDIQAVRTTHKKAESITDMKALEPPGDSPVYVVAMRGRFKCLCSPPLHQSVPPGSVVTFEIPVEGTKELKLVQWGLGDRYPHLQSMGTPVHLQSSNAN